MIVHIPLYQKNESTDVHDNFLVQEKNVFIMDNHRLALWSWMTTIDLNEKYNLLHIDAHPDMASTSLKDFDLLKHPIEQMELEEYQTIKQSEFNVPLFRWDNYLKIFTEKYSANFIKETSLSFTHHQGSSEGLNRDLAPNFLLKELDDIFSEKIFINENKWIVNLDLDYFFSSQPHKILLFSEEWIESIGKFINNGLKNNMIAVLTIAFSPECCGSWENAEKAYYILNKQLNLKFKPE